MSSGEYLRVGAQPDPATDTSETLEVSQEHDVPSSSDRVCDTIHFVGAEAEGIVYVVDGEIAWASSSLRAHSLYARLVSGGVQRHELEMTVALCRAENLNFCETLVSLGVLEEAAVREIMRRHLRDELQALLAMSDLRVAWHRSRRTFTGNLTVSLDDALDDQARVRWAQLVTEAGGTLTDRRREQRLPLRAVVNVDTAQGAIVTTLEDISRTGAFLRAPNAIELGSEIRVRASLAGEPLLLRAQVVRFRAATSKSPEGIGVRWVGLDADTAAALEYALDVRAAEALPEHDVLTEAG